MPCPKNWLLRPKKTMLSVMPSAVAAVRHLFTLYLASKELTIELEQVISNSRPWSVSGLLNNDWFSLWSFLELAIYE